MRKSWFARFGFVFSFLVLALIFRSAPLFSQDSVNFPNENNKSRTSFYVAIGYPLSTTSPDFFHTYNALLFGRIKEFKPAADFIAGAKIKLGRYYRVGLEANYFNSSLYENTRQLDIDSSKFRDLTEDFSINTLPLVVTAEVTPVISQFFTYFGAGAGIAASTIKWKETVSPVSEVRTGGTHFDKTIISPVVRLYSGVELNFDDNPQKGFLGSLFLQADITYMFRQADIFRGLSSQYLGTASTNLPMASQTYTILPVYICLNIGVSFNFSS